MDSASFVARHVWHGGRDENVYDRQSQRDPALGKGTLGRFRALRRDIGIARRGGDVSAPVDGYPALADGTRRCGIRHHSGFGNFFRSCTEEGI